LPDVEEGHPAAALASLFLAFVFREVEAELKARFRDDALVLLWNVGCPMDYLDADRKGEWERMVGVAMDLRGEISNPSELSLLADAAERLRRFRVPDPSERSYSVEPEGLAAVKAFLESPHAESKTYAIVDVGAGTTEVSFFFNGEIRTEPGWPLRPSYLADSTEPIGGGSIDLELAKAWNCGVEQARQRKEAGEPGMPVVPSIETICVQYKRTCWDIGLNHRLVAANDKRFDLFIIGGGGRLRPLQDALRNSCLPWGFVRERLQCLRPPQALRNGASIRGCYDLFANACGLASSLEWEYYPDVTPLPPPDPGEMPDVEALYPK
jgi:hypothetical protein